MKFNQTRCFQFLAVACIVFLFASYSSAQDQAAVDAEKLTQAALKFNKQVEAFFECMGRKELEEADLLLDTMTEVAQGQTSLTMVVQSMRLSLAAALKPNYESVMDQYKSAIDGYHSILSDAPTREVLPLVLECIHLVFKSIGIVLNDNAGGMEPYQQEGFDLAGKSIKVMRTYEPDGNVTAESRFVARMIGSRVVIAGLLGSDSAMESAKQEFAAELQRLRDFRKAEPDNEAGILALVELLNTSAKSTSIVFDEDAMTELESLFSQVMKNPEVSVEVAKPYGLYLRQKSFAVKLGDKDGEFKFDSIIADGKKLSQRFPNDFGNLVESLESEKKRFLEFSKKARARERAIPQT